jgi:choline dehydrogenase-like flavoprotein
LQVLTGAYAGRLVFSEKKDASGNLLATGIEFTVGGKSYVANVEKDVILSAGPAKTPQLLELSGIGRPDVLAKAGVKALVDLPDVGENLQDHVFAPAQFMVKEGIRTLDRMLQDPAYMEEQQKL